MRKMSLVQDPEREIMPGTRYDENSLYTFNEKITSQSSLDYSEELFQLVDAMNRLIHFKSYEAMRHMEQIGSNNDGWYFTKEDYV
jgi:RAB protein geranylgeranyltransferase component A